MKNRNFLKNSIVSLLPIAMAMGALFGVYKKPITEANAYTKDGQLVSTIKLKDNTDQEIKNYYSSLNNLSSSELQGNNLLKNLKPILKNNQKYFKYDGDSLWALYEIIDRDWEKSPASAISGYDPSTNTITGYEYGTSMSNKGTNPYIHALYVDRNVDNQTRAWDDHQQTQWGINQEHIWPKSQGFNAGGAGGARGDPMHLWAGNGRVNGTEHNNNMYGFVDLNKSYTNPYDAKSFKNLKDNYSGKSLTVPTSTDTVFEPQDCDKGDIARAIFYMVARYNNIAGNDTTINQDNPNLTLSQTTKSLTSYTTTYSNKQTGYMGLMTDLLYWNHLDPVDEFEIHRNNLLFNNYTFNRNPFIDYPEWADYIWGKPVYNGRNYVSYSSTPTGSVNLSADVINGFKGEQPQQVTVTSIEVTTKPTKLVYNAGETLDTTGMVVKAHMSNNTTKTLSASEYTVSPSGALKASDTQVTVSYQGKSTSFAIAVKSGGGSQTKTVTYTLNLTKDIFPSDIGTSGGYANFNGNHTVTATSQDGKTKDVLITTNQVMIGTGENADKLQFQGSKGEISGSIDGANVTSITSDITTLTLTKNGGSFSAKKSSSNAAYPQYIQVVFTVEEEGGGTSTIDVSSITLNKTSTTLEIGQSDNLSATVAPTNATIQLVSWSSSNSAIVEVSDSGEITAKSAGTATITCAALDDSGVTATCAVTVNAPVVLSSISLSGEYPREFYVGDSFSSEGLVVTANFSDNTHQDVTDDVEITGYDPDDVGEQTITVAYGDKTATYIIEVKEKGLAPNEIMFIASQLGLVNSDDLGSYTDSIATLTFVKGSGTQPKYYSSSSSFRVYAKNSFTIVGTKNIVKIEFEMASNDTVGSNTISANVGNLSGTTWTGSNSSVTFSVAGTSGQRNITSIKITYDESSADVKVLSSISLSGSYKTEFFKSEVFTYEGLIVTAHYIDETSSVVTPTSVSSPTMSTSGTKLVTVTYSENGVEKSESYQIEVIDIVGVSIELTGNYKTEYKVGDEFSTSGMTVVEHKNNGTTQNHLPLSCTFEGYDLSTPGDQTVTVTYGSLYTTYQINVKGNGKIVEERSVSLNIGTYASANSWANETKHLTINANSDITFTAAGSNNTGKYYTSGNNWRFYQAESPSLTISAPSNGKIKSIEITYSKENTGILTFGSSNIASGETVSINAQSAVFGVGNTGTVSNGQVRITNIEVVYEMTIDDTGKTLDSISISGNYKTEFNVGDEFSFGGTVTATYSDDSTEDVTAIATFSGYDMSTAKNQVVTVTYSEKTTTYSITVTQSVVPPTPVGGLSYSKITSLDDIEEGSKYIIGYEDGDKLLAMPNTFAKKMVPIELAFNSETVTDSNNSCYITFSNVSGTTTKSASITNGKEFLNVTSDGTDFTIGSTGTNWEISCQDGVFAFKNGGRGLIYKTGQMNRFGNYAISNIGSEYHNVCIYKEVEQFVPTDYKLVTEASTLGNDDEIIIVGIKNKTNYFAMGDYSTANKHMNVSAVSRGNGVITSNKNCTTFTLEKSDGKYGLKCDKGYYSAPGNTWSECKFSYEKTDLSTFTISITSTGVATICADIETGSRFIRYNQSVAYMSCYTSNKTASDVYIYKKASQYDADEWSKSFLEITDHCEMTESQWDDLSTSYSELSSDAQHEISSASPVYDNDSNLRQQAAARYDYIVSDPRYNVEAFISDRAVAPANRNVITLIDIKDNPTLFIVLFALAGLTTIGAYVYIKRRKEADI